jgi:hypothetical protein
MLEQEKTFQWKIRPYDWRFEDDEAKIIVDANFRIGKALHDRLILAIPAATIFNR